MRKSISLFVTSASRSAAFSRPSVLQQCVKSSGLSVFGSSTVLATPASSFPSSFHRFQSSSAEASADQPKLDNSSPLEHEVDEAARRLYIAAATASKGLRSGNISSALKNAAAPNATKGSPNFWSYMISLAAKSWNPVLGLQLYKRSVEEGHQVDAKALGYVLSFCVDQREITVARRIAESFSLSPASSSSFTPFLDPQLVLGQLSLLCLRFKDFSECCSLLTEMESRHLQLSHSDCVRIKDEIMALIAVKSLPFADFVALRFALSKVGLLLSPSFFSRALERACEAHDTVFADAALAAAMEDRTASISNFCDVAQLNAQLRNIERAEEVAKQGLTWAGQPVATLHHVLLTMHLGRWDLDAADEQALLLNNLLQGNGPITVRDPIDEVRIRLSLLRYLIARRKPDEAAFQLQRLRRLHTTLSANSTRVSIVEEKEKEAAPVEAKPEQSSSDSSIPDEKAVLAQEASASVHNAELEGQALRAGKKARKRQEKVQLRTVPSFFSIVASYNLLLKYLVDSKDRNRAIALYEAMTSAPFPTFSSSSSSSSFSDSSSSFPVAPLVPSALMSPLSSTPSSLPEPSSSVPSVASAASPSASVSSVSQALSGFTALKPDLMTYNLMGCVAIAFRKTEEAMYFFEQYLSLFEPSKEKFSNFWHGIMKMLIAQGKMADVESIFEQMQKRARGLITIVTYNLLLAARKNQGMEKVNETITQAKNANFLLNGHSWNIVLEAALHSRDGPQAANAMEILVTQHRQRPTPALADKLRAFAGDLSLGVTASPDREAGASLARLLSVASSLPTSYEESSAPVPPSNQSSHPPRNQNNHNNHNNRGRQRFDRQRSRSHSPGVSPSASPSNKQKSV